MTEPKPTIIVDYWRVFEVKCREIPIRTRHVVGYVEAWLDGRVSSPVQQFTPSERLVSTRSGNLYTLRGAPGDGGAYGQHVFDRWLALHEVTDVVDVSSEYWLAIVPKRSQS